MVLPGPRIPGEEVGNSSEIPRKAYTLSLRSMPQSVGTETGVGTEEVGQPLVYI